MIERLVVISPCRNEEQYIELTLRSVAKQTRRPDRWLIVDDCSTDSSAEIVERYAAEHPWIELVRRRRTGGRELGPGVVSAFNAGLERLGGEPYDVIAKLDCDLAFEPDVFAAILAHFDNDRVGMASGSTWLVVGNKLVFERYQSFHVPGQAKFYRRDCFEAIGGLQPIYGWDILDETEARRHGWVTLSDPNITFKHFRLQGVSFGVLRGRAIWGQGAYAIGSHPLFALGRAIFRMAEWPWIVGGLAFMWGFLSSHFKKSTKRNANRESIRYLRREQLYRLFHGNRLPPKGHRR